MNKVEVFFIEKTQIRNAYSSGKNFTPLKSNRLPLKHLYILWIYYEKFFLSFFWNFNFFLALSKPILAKFTVFFTWPCFIESISCCNWIFSVISYPYNTLDLDSTFKSLTINKSDLLNNLPPPIVPTKESPPFKKGGRLLSRSNKSSRNSLVLAMPARCFIKFSMTLLSITSKNELRIFAFKISKLKSPHMMTGQS